jgi:hypothetical protein
MASLRRDHRRTREHGRHGAVAEAHGVRVIRVSDERRLRRGDPARHRGSPHSRIVTVDGDASYPIEYVGETLRRLDRFDLVIGRRTGTTYYRSLLSYPFRLV